MFDAMMRDTNLILNWSSYLIHCLVLVMLIFSFCMPYWYISELSVDGGEIAGLWARCHVGGSCRPVHDTLDPSKYPTFNQLEPSVRAHL